MPRCFLAKNHHHDQQLSGTSKKWEEDSPLLSAPGERRSLVGSISAAQAVQSIQEPLRIKPEPAAAVILHRPVAPQTSVCPALPTEPLTMAEVTTTTSSTLLPRVPLPPSAALTPHPSVAGPALPFGAEAVGVKEELPDEPRASLQDLSASRPPMDRPRMSPLFAPPPPSTSLPSRVRTKEETDAAHDLLQLSRSLPPLPPQQPPMLVQHHQHHPPTPPTPEDDRHQQQYTTLIYISGGADSNANTTATATPLTPDLSAEYHHHQPLTPPTDSNSSSASSVSPSSPSPSLSSEQAGDSPPPNLTIVDGRTKKHRDGSNSNTKEKSKYTCSECGKNYATSSNLSRHKQTHRSLDSANAKKCHICGKMYVSMPALSMHILTHNLNHRCNVCGKAFSRPWLLQGHLRSHTGHKPYSCTVCKKAFADRSNLRAHMQTHSPSKNFQCSRCHKTFALKSYLNKHYESSCVRSSSSLSQHEGRARMQQEEDDVV